jgi:hypothetical protein
MHEIFWESVNYVNLPFTVLLAVVMFYWLLVALGALDTDFGSDADGDFGAHAHLDSHDGQAHGHSDAGWFSGAFHFINLGDVPLMVVLSVLALCLWTGSLIANYYFTDHQALLALAFLVPNLIVSLVVTRYLTLPLRPVFRMLRRDEDDHVPVIGQPCRITTSTANEKFGQAQIETNGAPLLIDVRTIDDTALPRGATAVVVREDKERGIYFVVEVPQPQLS